ncbi:hypothetical protein M5689_003388 [Euphorbia peplus]|nr:hypothetical protein M5689_003388 [Euphorbia peplus]
MDNGKEDLDTKHIVDGDNVMFNNDDSSDQDKREKSDVDENKTIDYFINEKVWDEIGKELQDYDENDMDMLKWKSLDECINFYYTYAKVKGFGVRRETAVKSRTTGQIILKTLVCRVQGFRREEWNVLPDRQTNSKTIN